MNTLSNVPVFCINLKQCIKRKNIMQKQFESLGCNYTFCEAIDYDNINVGYTKKYKRPKGVFNNKEGKNIINDIKCSFKKNNIVSKVHIKCLTPNYTSYNWCACTLSHLYYIFSQYFHRSNHEVICMCEDDISFEYIPQWENTLDEIIKNAPNNWSIIKLHCSNVEILKKYINSENKYIKITSKQKKFFWSTGLYVINKKGMKLLFDTFYDKKNNIFKLYLDYPVADSILQSIPDSYYYSIPLVKNNNIDYDLKTTLNTICNKPHEKTGIEFVENFYNKNNKK